MFKKKIHLLVERNKLNDTTGFEIISDSGAATLVGGLSACGVLQKCATYSGDCPSLLSCGNYNVPPPCSSLQQA
jgi:hypothetical protein